MRTSLVLAMTVLSGLATVALRAAPGDKPNPGWGKEADRCTLQIGDKAPDFTLKDPDGKNEIALAKLKGQPCFLLFGSYT